MKSKAVGTALAVMIGLILVLPALSAQVNVENALTLDAPQWLLVRGLVEKQLNLSYRDLWSFPLVSEVAELECIVSGVGGLSVIYNWTGVPLFYLLSLAGVRSGGSRLVVFNAVDGFSNNLNLEAAMHPSTILALEANGTDLNELSDFGSGCRIVLPGRWGYKWVKWVSEIIVVDGQGLAYNEGFRPNSSISPMSPPLQTIQLKRTHAPETVNYPVFVFTHASVESVCLRSDVRLSLRVSGSSESDTFVYIAFPEEMLAEPYSVFSSQNLKSIVQISSGRSLFIYMEWNNENGPIEIEVWGSYTPEILQFLGPYYDPLGIEYYNIECGGHVMHLVSQY